MARLASFVGCCALLLLAAACVSAAPVEDRITSIPDYGPLLSNYYGGYLNATDGRQAYYVFIESSGTPATAPLVLWLNGGPGCSSLLGLFEENGPYLMRHGGHFEANAFNWSQFANILYIESPGGVGFSTDTNPATAWTDDLAAEFNFAALQSFFRKFPEYTTHHFYIAGESYAGFYVPELAYRIFTSDDAVLKAQMQGFMVGNPCTGDIGCCNPDPFLDPYLRYNGFMPLVAGAIPDWNATSTFDEYDLLEPSCPNGAVLMRARFPHPVLNALRKKMAKLGDAPPPYGPCANNHVTAWLNRPDVAAAIHALPDVKWESCSTTIKYQCNLNGVVPIYRKLMDGSNYKIMIYSGLDDSIVNMAQTQNIVNDMGRPLVSNVFQAWYLPDVYNASIKQLGGFFLEYDRISWCGVRDAGHMVPEYNPPAGLEVFRSFLELGRPGRLHD